MITPVLTYEMPSTLEILQKKINDYLIEKSRSFSCSKLFIPNSGCSGTTVLGCQSSSRTKPNPDYCGYIHKK